ncbi:hypothetical protein [Parendozoicomonas haliclonae]|uniref:Uncharacterized protein n=1 Tax=Parendozoicomonas haliclonae TaxID=1960125 RepID=A0A1X7AGL6_9GAMM|nr:hypothetical protein [Parendozoicomonas haliclonae]SMA33318.1 hypothetical protein EHSB41UT_00259 [Parendozoicomonas haliclonae]
MSGSDAPEAEVSESSKQQAIQAAAKYEEWRDDGYKQLELDALNTAGKDTSRYFEGRAAADIAGGAQGVPQHIMQSTGGQALAMDAGGRNIADAFSTASQDARTNAQSLQLQQKLEAAGIGQNVAQQSAGALNSMAATSTNNALQKLSRDTMVHQSEQAIAQGAISGASSGLMMRAGNAVGSDGSFDMKKFKDGMSWEQMSGAMNINPGG